ncbi:MAG: GNAT family N-acetyltransferase [Candidatus Thorarchaeota archaeon]
MRGVTHDMVVRIRWDLTGELPRLRENRAVVVVPALEEHLDVMGEILMRTWGGFIRSPEVTRRRVGPSLSAGIEQPFIAYLGDRPVGCVSPRLDLDSRIGVLDGGVHVLPEYRRQSIGSTLLKTALKWLKDRGMVAAEVTPFNPEGDEAVKRAIAFYLASGGRCQTYPD